VNVIKLDMNITADEALAAHDALPQAAPKQKRDAYWRRYSRIKNGIRDACTYTSSDEAQHATPPAAPADRLDMIRRIAERGESAPVRPLAPMPKPPAETKAPPWVHAPAPKPRIRRVGRKPAIDPRDTGAIHARIGQLAAALGYGTFGVDGVKPVWGAFSQFARKAGCVSESVTHETIRAGTKIWPSVIDGLVENLGASPEWLLHGTGEMLAMAVEGAHFEPRPTKTPPRQPSRFAAPPPAHPGKAIADPEAMTQPLIKRPPGGALFDPIAFNADQTFSIVGKKAFVSRYASANEAPSEQPGGKDL
jgi:hypothetical protein